MYSYAFDAFLELVVDEKRQVLGRAHIQVDKVLKVGVDALLEELVVVERHVQEEVGPLLQVEQILNENNGRFVRVLGVGGRSSSRCRGGNCGGGGLDCVAGVALLFDGDQIATLLAQVHAHAVGDGLQAVGHAVEELVHVGEIVVFVVLEHVIDAGVLHVDDGFHVSRDELVLEHLDDARLGRLVQVVVGSLALLAYPLVHLAYVDAGAVLGQELLTLHAIELGRLLQERLLEVLVVDGARLDAQHHEHLAGVLDGAAIGELRAPLLLHHVEEGLTQVVLDLRVAHDHVAEEYEAEVVDGLDAVRLHVDAVHVHEYVAYHDHGGLVVVPRLVEHVEEVVVE